MNSKSTILGDKHGGKQTLLIENEEGSYILKYRSSQNEECFNLFCLKVEELGFFRFSRTPLVLKKGEDFHTQKVEKNERTDEYGVNLYYKRAGALLFFAYLLGSNDLHCENLIANGDMPVVIDLETLLTGKPRGTSDAYNLSQSVMRSHLLCSFMNVQGKTVDVSGFGGVTAELKNIPHTEKGKAFPWDKKDVFRKGFESAYVFAIKHKEEILKLTHIFDRCKFRQILRPTKTYDAVSAVLSKLDGNTKEYATMLLSRAYEKDTDKNRLEKAKLVLQNEVEAVMKNEIPLFYTYGNETSLYCNGHKVQSEHLVLSPVDYALSRLEKLSPWDMERQLKIISLAMDASTPIEKAKKNICVNVGALCPGEKTANEVSNCAVDGLNSVFCGLGRDKNGNVDFVSHNYSLYQGLCGVLCMYASLFRKTGKDIYKDFLYRYYEKVRNVLLESDSKILLTDKNSSLGDGITGMISCIGHIGKLVEDSSFISDARALTDRLEFAENISNTDYLNGIGALLPLLEKLDSGLFSHASALLLPLFESASPFTTGMAHGGSGVAVSLCALNKSKKSPKIEDRILSLLQWENSHYSENDNNWFDLRDKTKKGFMGGWCSGAPGIGMARRYIEKNTNNVDLKNICKVDIERVNRFLEERMEYKRDTLCCGTSSALMVSSFMGASAHRLYKYLCDAEKRNAIRVFNVVGTCDKNVSLMQGMAGIAYALAMYGDALCGGMLI